MVKRTDSEIEFLQTLVESVNSGDDHTFSMDSKADAVNFRQRIYNYRNALIADPSVSNAFMKKVNKVKVSIEDNTVYVSLKVDSYMEKLLKDGR